jgi:transposase-like protein
MMLARLTPGHAGFEIQSFECPKCNHQLTVEVGEVDPLKSADGWLNAKYFQARDCWLFYFQYSRIMVGP